MDVIRFPFQFVRKLLFVLPNFDTGIVYYKEPLDKLGCNNKNSIDEQI